MGLTWGGFALPQGIWSDVCGQLWLCTRGVPLAWSGQRPGMLSIILHCTGPAPADKESSHPKHQQCCGSETLLYVRRLLASHLPSIPFPPSPGMSNRFQRRLLEYRGLWHNNTHERSASLPYHEEVESKPIFHRTPYSLPHSCFWRERLAQFCFLQCVCCGARLVGREKE